MLLQEAIISANEEQVTSFLDDGADPSKILDLTGQNALHQAVAHTQPTLVKLLLDRGADVNVSTAWGQSVLYIALNFFSDTDDCLLVIERLLASRASIEPLEDSSISMIHFSVLLESSRLTKMLCDNNAEVDCKMSNGMTALWMAMQRVFDGSDKVKSVVEVLLASGASTETTVYEEQQRPIHAAAYKGNTWLAKCLCDAGAEVDAKMSDGRTALLVAVQEVCDGSDTHRSVVELLISNGACLEAMTSKGWRPIHYAATCGETWLLDFLCHAGAEVDAKLPDGTTALHVCCNPGTMEKLIGHGADVGMTSTGGWTPLMYAMIAPKDSTGVIDKANLLLAAGADPDAKTPCGLTALEVATMKCCTTDVVKMLLRAGARVNLQVLKNAIERVCLSASSDDLIHRVQVIDIILLTGEFDQSEKCPSFFIDSLKSRATGGNAAANVIIKKLSFCRFWHSHKLLFLIRGKNRVVWPVPRENKRVTRSAKNNQVVAWLLSESGAPGDVFLRVVGFIVPSL